MTTISAKDRKCRERECSPGRYQLGAPMVDMMLPASAGGNRVPVTAQLVQVVEGTVRDVIHRFNEIGLARPPPDLPPMMPRGGDDQRLLRPRWWTCPAGGKCIDLPLGAGGATFEW
ncbi:hypothetical protein ABIE67_007490 [Streptomyces sp. V4I8]